MAALEQNDGEAMGVSTLFYLFIIHNAFLSSVGKTEEFFFILHAYLYFFKREIATI